MQAHQQGTSISELVRQAARERFLGKPESRRQAMRALVGIRRDQPESSDLGAYVRGLRRGTRLKRLRKT